MIASIVGFANFVAMVDAERGKELQQRVLRIIERHGRGYHEYAQRQRWQGKPHTDEEIVVADFASTHQQPPQRRKPPGDDSANRPWWKFW